jgi:hypothetical protein
VYREEEGGEKGKEEREGRKRRSRGEENGKELGVGEKPGETWFKGQAL